MSFSLTWSHSLYMFCYLSGLDPFWWGMHLFGLDIRCLVDFSDLCACFSQSLPNWSLILSVVATFPYANIYLVMQRLLQPC